MAGPSSVRTRGGSSTLMSEYLDKGKEMLRTELPTTQVWHPVERDKFNPTSVLVKAILIEIKERWQRANF